MAFEREHEWWRAYYSQQDPALGIELTKEWK